MRQASAMVSVQELELQDRVQWWRRVRTSSRARMPEQLWADAVSLAKTTGVYRTCQTLGLNYDSLKKRVAEQAGANHADAAPAFVEVLMPRLPGKGGETVVELVNQHGDRMRLSGAVDVGGLVRAFCGREP